MAKYIDKAAVLAEIERKMNLCKKILLRSRTPQNDDYHQGNIEAYEVVISLLDTLEMKEVDLEKELIIWHRLHFKKEGTFENYGGFYLANSSQLDLAKHFFELGMKTQQKGGQQVQHIDISVLLAEIEREYKSLSNATNDFAMGRKAELKNILSFIESIYQ